MPVIDVQLGHHYNEDLGRHVPMPGCVYEIFPSEHEWEPAEKRISEKGKPFDAILLELLRDPDRTTDFTPTKGSVVFGYDINVRNPKLRRDFWMHISANPSYEKMTVDIDRVARTVIMRLRSCKGVDEKTGNMLIQSYDEKPQRPAGHAIKMQKSACDLLYKPKGWLG